jgi:hypothetical protein
MHISGEPVFTDSGQAEPSATLPDPVYPFRPQIRG